MTPHLFLTALSCAVAVAVLARVTVFRKDRTRRMVWRSRFRMRPAPGFASQWELIVHLGRLAAIWHGRRARQDLTTWGRIFSPAYGYAVRLGRGPWFRRLYTPGEDQVAIVAPPRTYKSAMLADRIYIHPGAVVSCTTRADIFDLTSGKRATLGPVWVFNPEGVGNVPSTFRVDIVADCADPEIARQTASALVGPLSESGDSAQWQAMAKSALAGLLHAAAVLGEDMSAVWAWTSRLGEHQVRDALQRPGISVDVLAPAIALQKDSRTQDSIRTFIAEALGWVSSPRLRSMVSGPGLTLFDADQFIATCGTVYFISTGNDTSAAPLFRAVIEKLYRECRLAGSRSPYRRIPNPVLFALDEVTQTAAVPLNIWLATAAGDGIQVCYVVHTPAQLREQYGDAAADAIWQLAGTKLILGGNSDPDLADAIGTISGWVTFGESKEAVIPADFLRQLPGLRALVMTRNRRPVVVKIRPIWKRPAHRLPLRRLALRFGRLYEPALVSAPVYLAPVPPPAEVPGSDTDEAA